MEFVMDCLGVNDKGNLTMGGCDLGAIAEAYGTPAYVMDETTIRENCRLYRRSIEDFYQGNGLALYASKALSCKGIYRIVKEEGMGVDVVSGGELYTALAAEFPSERIYFHGNNKTEAELKMALVNGVGRIVVDNREELEALNRLAGEMGKTQKILFRIKPGIDAHTHSFVQTGQIDSKFGVALETGEAEAIIRHALTLSHVEVVGIHCHIGSQIFELEPFRQAARVMLGFMAEIKQNFGLELAELNLGGGFGIKYVKEDTPIDYPAYMEAVAETVEEECRRLHLTKPFIVMEPGRSIVASAGLTLYRVGSVKEIPGIRTYLSVDGGMADNPRFIMYGSEYEAVLVNKPTAKADTAVTVAGRCCESGDVLIQGAKLPKAEAGDILAVLATGAYNYSMASHYNRLPNPPIILVKDGMATELVRRETYEDLLRCDL